MRLLARRLRDALAMAAVAVALLAAAEGATRMWLRWRTGTWPHTLAVSWEDAREAVAQLYRRHPYLVVGPREGARDPREGRIVLNGLGYRSPERPREKPAGVRRVVCAGGSTTYDTFAASNAVTWPVRLEVNLTADPGRVEVWNAGFPSWTTLENLIAFELRDVDLSPDLVILYQGINDLQPLTQATVDPQYEGLHAERVVSALGIEDPPVPWYRRLVLLERAGALLFGPPRLDLVPPSSGPRNATIGPEGLRVFARNVRSFVAIAHAHGAEVLLVTQPLRRRAAHVVQDRDVFDYWLPDLTPETAAIELERLNDVLRRLSGELGVPLADAARDVAWVDTDFSDPMHTTAAGSQKLADFLAPPVRRVLAARSVAVD